jgi:tetratricopeptide (TPR) repeat protein
VSTPTLENSRTPVWVWLLPALAAVLLFWRVLGAEFLYDDLELIRDNPAMADWSTFWRAFQVPFWQLASIQETHNGFYRPVGGAAFVTLYHLGGGRPMAFHAASLLVHAMCSAMVAMLATRIGLSRGVAVFAGLFFAIYGGHVEAIAWASALPDLLATLFSILALWAFLGSRLIWAGLFLLLAMLSKEAAYATWLLMIGMAIWRGGGKIPQQRQVQQVRSRTLPALAVFLTVGTVVYLARYLAFDGPAAGFDIQTTHHRLSGEHQLILSLGLIWQYLEFLVWPIPSHPFQPLRLDLSPTDWALGGPALFGALLTLAAAIWWMVRGAKRPLILVGLGTLFAGLAPVLNTKAIGRFPFEERFAYLPSVGFALLFAATAIWLIQKARVLHKNAGPLLAAAAVASLIGASLYTAFTVTPHWNNESEFFTWAKRMSPDQMTPYLGSARVKLTLAETFPDRSPQRTAYAESAFRDYERSLQVDPDKVLVSVLERERGNVGQANALFLAGDFQTAEAVYRETLKGYPRSTSAHYGLSSCLLYKAEVLAQAQKWDQLFGIWEDALFHAQESINGPYTKAGAYHNKSVALYQLKRPDEAMAPALQSVALEPSNYTFVTHLAELYFIRQDWESMIQVLESFVAAAPPGQFRDEARKAALEIRTNLDQLKAGAIPPPAGSGSGK